MENSLLIRALHRKPTERTPVWVMRQAGRYLPEYRKVRATFPNFVEMCQTPEAACEVTLQPIRRFALDASIIFSDILTIPDAMGLGLAFSPGEGPFFHRPINTLADIERLALPPAGSLNYVMDAISLTRRELPAHIPLLGFCGSPWTLATYMVEGRSSKNFNKIRRLLYAEPAALHQLLTKLAAASADYVNQQIAAGANALMIFDSWGGVLAPETYQAFSAQYMAQIIRQLDNAGGEVPVIVFTKGGRSMVRDHGANGLSGSGFGLDHRYCPGAPAGRAASGFARKP